MDFVKNDQLIQVIGQIKLRLCQFGEVAFGLQVKVDAGDGLGCFERERCFANLAWPEQGNSSRMLEFTCELCK